MQPQSLLKRKPKSDIASLFVGVLSRDKNGRPKTLVVPGSAGKSYHVIVRRYDNRVVTLECNLNTSGGLIACKGNSSRYNVKSETICYHSIAAFDKCLSLAGLKGMWCKDYQSAEKLNRMYNGQIYVVKSHQNTGGVAYVIVTGDK